MHRFMSAAAGSDPAAAGSDPAAETAIVALVTIGDVPDDCLGLVLAFLPLREVGMVRRVCWRFYRLDSAAWNAAQTPVGRLRAVNAAPDGPAQWVLAGAAGCETVVDNSCTPALWRAEIRALLAQSSPNPLRKDRMPAGAFWEPRVTLQECLRVDSAEGLAFIADRGCLDISGWWEMLGECLRAQAPRMLAYTCAHSGLDAQAVYEIIAMHASSPECYALCAEYFPKPAPPPQWAWLKALSGNYAALCWLGCEPAALLESGNTDAARQKLIKKTLAVMIQGGRVSRSMALWLRPLLAEAVAAGWCFRKQAHAFAHVFARFLLEGQLESAQLLADFYLNDEPELVMHFPEITLFAVLAGRGNLYRSGCMLRNLRSSKPKSTPTRHLNGFATHTWLICRPNRCNPCVSTFLPGSRSTMSLQKMVASTMFFMSGSSECSAACFSRRCFPRAFSRIPICARAWPRCIDAGAPVLARGIPRRFLRGKSRSLPVIRRRQT